MRKLLIINDLRGGPRVSTCLSTTYINSFFNILYSIIPHYHYSILILAYLFSLFIYFI